MRTIKNITLAILLSVLLFSCSYNSSDKTYNPTTLKELHDGFFDEELTADSINSHKDEITIIATGHLYPLLKFPGVYSAMIDSIKNQKPDYIFLQGDLVRDNTAEEWDIVLKRFKEVGCPLYFAPGNHDLNYHDERWVGSREHQFEAEMNYVNHVGYRYKLLKDQFADYVFINPNDSLTRVTEYLSIIKPQLDTTKLLILLTSQALWHNTNQIEGDPRSWVNKAFTRDEIMPRIEYFDYLIHGDWGGKFYQGTWPKKNGKFNVISVGNKKLGDSLFLTKIVIGPNKLTADPIMVIPPENSGWFSIK
jgi:hypothetical protein